MQILLTYEDEEEMDVKLPSTGSRRSNRLVAITPKSKFPPEHQPAKHTMRRRPKRQWINPVNSPTTFARFRPKAVVQRKTGASRESNVPPLVLLV